MDSATSTCARNPACYTTAPGDEPILPWLSRSIEAGRTAVAVSRLLDAAEMARVEQVLEECVEEANFKVNERMLGKGVRPTREICWQSVGKDSRGNDITRAMQLGQEKHRVAFECAQQKLGQLAPDNFSMQPHYHYDRKTKRIRLIDPAQVDEWLRNGLLDMLLGMLIPDVVIHESGNPLKAQAVYDFKFPCPASNEPRWTNYPTGHPYSPATQGDMYGEALKVERVARVAPVHGVRP